MQANEERNRKIANVLETYFSDACLLWDKVMLNKVVSDPEGMVSFESLSKLSKFKSLNATPDEIKTNALGHSLSRLKLDSDQNKIARIKPYIANKKEELDDWSIYVEGLVKPYDNEHTITALFNSIIGHVSFFRIPPNQQNKTPFLSYCFIEFDNRENVDKAVKLLNRYDGATSDLEIADELNLRVMSKLYLNKYKDEYVNLLSTRKREIKQLWDDFYEKYPEGEFFPEKKAKKMFEEGLVVFVDGLHPQCAKTAASTLLQTSGVDIAFMHNKKKGLASTHIRLKTPEDSKKICQYFGKNHLVQGSAKDVIGKEHDTKTFDCLKLRLLKGTEEEIYWENEAKLRQ
ncbi:hypothetical protein EDC94DRAFT_385647 [Helicostylum pulchrum]|uniref:RRM domain-containing protein n=1 Tax=Helicostylum pulchrum TaxID=562976 RepID=A0ABP9XTX4_9FUNG|nr:hypothetical protein EDC94DRAFT_385647 [Helicostylum pulchrum]